MPTQSGSAGFAGAGGLSGKTTIIAISATTFTGAGSFAVAARIIDRQSRALLVGVGFIALNGDKQGPGQQLAQVRLAGVGNWAATVLLRVLGVSRFSGAGLFNAKIYQLTYGPGQVLEAVLDGGLSVIDTAATTIHVLSATPIVFADVAIYTLGNKTWAAGGAFAAPSNDPLGGRMISSTAFTDGSQTTAGNATDWAVIDATRLLATGKLLDTVVFTGSGTFEMPSFNISEPVQ